MAFPLEPGILSSTYRQYKKDTGYIAGWLAETSKKAGFKLSNDPPAPVSQQAASQRLKGKARKDAQKAAKSANSGTISAEYRIRVGDFIPMAEAISKAKSKLEAPSALMMLFCRAIEARKKAVEWFESGHFHSEDRDESNRRHGHFITVLETAASILKPLAPLPKKVSRENPRESDAQKLVNRFSKLATEDPQEPESDISDTVDVAAEPDESTLPPVAPAEIEQTEADAEDEFFFAIHAFLKTMHELREPVQEAWLLFKDGDCDLMTVALLANTAIDLVRKAEAEFELFLKRPARYPASKFPIWSLPALLYYNYHLSTHKLNAQDAVLPGEALVGHSGQDCPRLHWCFWPVYNGLKAYLNRVAKSRRPQTAVPSIVEEDFQSIGGVHPDTMRTCDLAMVLRGYTTQFPKTFALDEVTRGMAHMFKTREIPIWATFGIQLLLDIQDIMDYSMGKGEGYNVSFNCMRRVCEQEMDAWKDFNEWKGPFRRSDREQNTRDTLAFNLKHTYHKGIEYSFPAVEFNPIRCGLMMYDLLQKHQAAIRMESSTFHITMLGYVYVAGRLLHPDAPTWPDMEYLLNIQGSNHLFFGGYPKSLYEAFRKLELACGHSIRNAASDRRKKTKGSYMNVANCRCFEDTSLLGPVFMDRMLGSALTNEAVDKLVSRLNSTVCSKDSKARLCKQLSMTQDLVDLELRQRRFGVGTPSWAFTFGLINQNTRTSTTLLQDLGLFLQGEVMDVYFDWLKMHRICGDIWGDIVESNKDDEHYDDFMGDESLWAANNILMWAADDERNNNMKLDFHSPTFAPMLRKAWACIQSAIHKPDVHEFTIDRGLVWVGDLCLAKLAHQAHMVNEGMWQSHVDLNSWYKGWDDDELDESRVHFSFQHRIHRSMKIHDKKLDLKQSGLEEECDHKEDFEFEPNARWEHCGRCRRRKFWLNRPRKPQDFRIEGTNKEEKKVWDKGVYTIKLGGVEYGISKIDPSEMEAMDWDSDGDLVDAGAGAGRGMKQKDGVSPMNEEKVREDMERCRRREIWRPR